jgi:uncharacterized 2Fe-2S/4Fe-4S cluster protein (DUF4445 family)
LKLSEQLAVAIDLGTTTIAVSLVAMGSGRRLAMTGGLNPQREWGADVVTRLAAAQASPGNLLALQRAVNASLERFTLELLNSVGAAATDLQVIAIAGNPTMEHLLLGLPVASLAAPPYRPLFSVGKRVNTAELGWGMAAEAYIFPLPGGFVGGDLVAFLYGVESACSRSPISDPRSPIGPRLLLDLGTNGEVALITGGKIYATSAAAGPAFEGGNLTCGMAALPGAINGVAVTGDRLSITTISGKTPVGICGSAVIAAIAGLLDAGVLDSTGRLLSSGEIPSNLANHLVDVAGASAFLLYRDAAHTVYLTQEDIRQVQLAKGAIRAGMEVLFERAGVQADDVQEVVLTGSFGAVLSPEHLKSIGIFTEHMVKITTFVSEGALAGTEHVLCHAAGSSALEELAAAVTVIPLSGTPRFEKHFLAHLDFR